MNLINSIRIIALAIFCIFAFAVMHTQPAFAQTESATPPKKTKTERLLKTELDEFASDKDGLTHLHWAAMANDVEAINRLVAVGAFVDPVEKSDESSYTEKTIRRAALLGIDLKNFKRRARTPLIMVSPFNKLDAVRALLAAGANVNAAENDGWTALIWSAYRGHAKVAEILLSAGADVNAVDNNGETALMLARSAEVAKVLLSAGADVNAVDDDGETALMLARSAEVAKVLLSAGADVNAVDDDGWTTLMWAAASKGHAEVAELLLSAGVNPNAKNKDGKTALFWAKEKGHSEVVRILKRAGARE